MLARFFAAALCLGIASSVILAEDPPPNRGQLQPGQFSQLPSQFTTPDRIYAPFAFWFWDEPLDAAKMAEMSRIMSSQGMNPGYAHARMSMVGTPSLPGGQWLGDPWFAAFSAALNEADKRHCYLGYCDEYWWPSLQAHGRVLDKHPELRAESLRWTVLDAAPGAEVRVPESFFAVAAEVVEPITTELVPPLGKWIWDPEGTETKHRCWFRKIFELPEGRKAVKAALRISVDNGYVLFLNGKKIGSGNDWNVLQTYDVTADLTSGRNLLAVEGKNLDGPFGLIFGLEIRFDDGTTVRVASDASWRTTLRPKQGWNHPRFDERDWSPAREIAPAGQGPWGDIGGGQPAYSHCTIRSQTLRLIGEGASFAWKAPEGKSWRIYAFNKYFHPGTDGGETNMLDPRLSKAFIGLALEPYARRLGDQLGKSIPGDFIDNEGDYGWQLAWSDALDRQYKERYGRDIRLWMPLMLDRDREGLFAKARWEWFDLVSDIYSANYRAVTDWHERRGMYTTAHVWEESLPAQANAVGDHLKFLRALTMPGQDCLGDKCFFIHDFKEAASVAEFKGTRATTELMGVAGWQGLDPAFLKRSVNAVTAWGMGHIIPHGVFTTRKLDGNPWMPDFYSESPTFPWMHLWNDFACRASLVNSQGRAVPDVLVYNPLESAWVLASVDMFGPIVWMFPEDRPEKKQINAIDRSYTKAISDLTDGRVEFLIGDRHYLAEMEVKEGRLVRGPFRFRTLVLPPLKILPLDAARKMLDFAGSGGRVYSLGELPDASVEHGLGDPDMAALMKELAAQPTFTRCPPEPADCAARWDYGPGWVYQTDASKHGLKPLIERRSPGLESPIWFVNGGFPMLQARRRIDGRDFFWLANNDPQQSQTCEVEVSGVRGAVSIWDCETGRIKPIASTDLPGGSRVKLNFKPLEAYWLVFDPEKPAQAVAAAEPKEEVLATVAGPWTVTYDPSIQPVMEHPVKPPAEFFTGVQKPLDDWRDWGLKKFSGLLFYEATLPVKNIQGRMALDLGTVHSAAEVWVNGKSCGKRLWGPYVFDVTAALKPGDNQLRILVANLPGPSYGIPQPQGLRGPVRLLSVK
jgi:hypothetical protein